MREQWVGETETEELLCKTGHFVFLSRRALELVCLEQSYTQMDLGLHLLERRV